ncbi:MAG: hypothetical protein AAFU67_12215 [Bacteroidota bacterium]
MNAIFKKLNYKQQAQIVALNVPTSFESVLAEMEGEAQILRAANVTDKIAFAIAFAIKQHEVDEAIAALAPKLKGDATLWFCYPKKSSKKYTCEFNRDTGWAKLGQFGFEGVRMVAIDEDWSALRFRKVEFIKSITRRKTMALTKEAKARTTSKK